jgi:hypothetical protein
MVMVPETLSSPSEKPCLVLEFWFNHSLVAIVVPTFCCLKRDLSSFTLNHQYKKTLLFMVEIAKIKIFYGCFLFFSSLNHHEFGSPRKRRRPLP